MPGRRSRARAAAQAHSASSTCWALRGSPRTRENVVASGRRGRPCGLARGAEPEQDPRRGGRGPGRCSLWAVVPGRPGRHCSRRQVAQRDPPPAVAPLVRHRAQEPAEPRQLGVVPGQGGVVTGQECLPGCFALPARHRAGQRPPSLRRQVGGQRRRQRPGAGAAGRNSGTAGSWGATAGSSSGTRARDSRGMADLSTRGSFAESGDFWRKNQLSAGSPAPLGRHAPSPWLPPDRDPCVTSGPPGP